MKQKLKKPKTEPKPSDPHVGSKNKNENRYFYCNNMRCQWNCLTIFMKGSYISLQYLHTWKKSDDCLLHMPKSEATNTEGEDRRKKMHYGRFGDIKSDEVSAYLESRYCTGM